MKPLSLAILTMGMVSLVGCSDSNTDIVKQSSSGVDQTLNMDQLLNHRQLCRETSWEEFEDERGREIVEYRCAMNEGQELFPRIYEKKLNSLTEQEARFLSKCEEYDTQRIENNAHKRQSQQDAEVKLNAIYAQHSGLEAHINNDVDMMRGADVFHWSSNYYHKPAAKQIFTTEQDYIKTLRQVHEVWRDIQSQKRGILSNAELAEKNDHCIQMAKMPLEQYQASLATKVIYSDIREIYQWSFDQERNPLLIYTGVEYLVPDGDSKHVTVKQHDALRYAIEDKYTQAGEHPYVIGRVFNSR